MFLLDASQRKKVMSDNLRRQSTFNEIESHEMKKIKKYICNLESRKDFS